MRPLRSVKLRTQAFLDRRDPTRPAARAGAELGAGTRIPPGTRFGCKVTVGEHTWFTGPPSFSGSGAVEIGRWCAIGEELRVITSDHETRGATMHLGLLNDLGIDHRSTADQVLVGHACWVGDRVTLLRSAKIGIGAVVGAGSVVRDEIPDFAIAVGVPARVVKRRFDDEMIDALMSISWWNWDVGRIRRNQGLFRRDLRVTPPSDLLESVRP